MRYFRYFLLAGFLLTSVGSLSSRVLVSALPDVKLTVGDSATSHYILKGTFGVGTNAPELPLLFDFPDPVSRCRSYFNLKLDGTLYSLSPFVPADECIGDYVEGGTPFVSGPSIVTSWAVPDTDGLRITQTLVPERLGSGRGIVRFCWEFVNNSSESHTVGLLLVFDLLISGPIGDDAPTSIGGVYSENERVFEGDIPTDYLAFSSTPTDTSVVVARGILYGYNATIPDIFGVLDASRRYPLLWDYDFDPLWRYSDCMVFYRWNEQEMLPGDTLIIETFFGPSDMVTSSGEMTIGIPEIEITSTGCRFDPDSIFIRGFVQNKLRIPTTLFDVQLCIHLPDGFYFPCSPETRDSCRLVDPSTLLPDSVGFTSWWVWLDEAEFPEPGTVFVSFTATTTTAGVLPSSIDVPTAIPYLISMDYEVMPVSPDTAIMFFSCPSTDFVYIISGDISAVDTSSAQFLFEGEIFDCSSGRIEFVDSLIIFHPDGFVHGEEVSACIVSLYDTSGCSVLRRPGGWNFTVDLEPPSVEFVSPGEDTVVASLFEPVVIHIEDPSGIVVDSILLLLNGEPVSPDEIVWNPDDALLTYVPADGFPDSTDITVCISNVQDIAEGCGANILVDTLCRHFRVETSGINETLPLSLAIKSVQPNPFNASCRITLDIPRGIAYPASLEIYNIAGELVDNMAILPIPGEKGVIWNADNLPSGIYILSLEAGSEKVIRKLVLIR